MHSVVQRLSGNAETEISTPSPVSPREITSSRVSTKDIISKLNRTSTKEEPVKFRPTSVGKRKIKDLSLRFSNEGTVTSPVHSSVTSPVSPRSFSKTMNIVDRKTNIDENANTEKSVENVTSVKAESKFKDTSLVMQQEEDRDSGYCTVNSDTNEPTITSVGHEPSHLVAEEEEEEAPVMRPRRQPSVEDKSEDAIQVKTLLTEISLDVETDDDLDLDTEESPDLDTLDRIMNMVYDEVPELPHSEVDIQNCLCELKTVLAEESDNFRSVSQTNDLNDLHTINDLREYLATIG